MNPELYAYGNNLSKMLGSPTSTTNAKGVTGTAAYDNFGRITQTAVANKAKLVYSYSGNKLSAITRTDLATSKAQSYTFSYDGFGRTTSVSVGSRVLATYKYNKDLLTTQTYGNGHAVSFTYDNLGRTKTATYSDGRVLTYTYTGDGLLHSIDVEDGPAPATYLYSYDTLGRLISSEMRDGSGNMILRTHQTYNEKNQLVGQSWQLGNTGYGETYEYNEADGSLKAMSSATGRTLQMGYDALRRLTSVNAGIYTRTYTYRDISTTQTTTQISGVSYSGLANNPTYGYTYDAVGNIATYTAPDGEVITYTYDDQGQLLSAVGDQTHTYTYDNVGNLLTGFGRSYTYSDSDWGDLLTAVNGVTISYDEIGNPLTWYNGSNWILSWENGRQLKEIKHISGSRKTVFTYDADGLRLRKTSDGITHDYTYAGGKLMREVITRPASGTVEVWDFFYDEAGRPFAVKVDGVMYYYITNLQGDVMQIVDSNGATVATYEYDPYGFNAGITGTFGYSNPIRYRGYYYDRETDFYYLQSRYYDPSVGRFINADSYASTGQGILGNNMFAYCGNNPVCCCDPAGTFFLYDWWNGLEDLIWKGGAWFLKQLGFDVTGDLLDLAASGPDNEYVAGKDSLVAQKIAADEGFTNAVRDAYKNDRDCSFDHDYQFVVSGGDLGAALHWVNYTYSEYFDKQTGKQSLLVVVTDDFDFTEFKNPFEQGSFMAGLLWFVNDIAYIDTEWGLLDNVPVRIEVVISIDP